MNRLYIAFFLSSFLATGTFFAQTVNNGTFSSGTTGWGCNPETYDESVYGGPGGNSVAEVDATAGLCQTISGFTPGSYYRLTFLCSRRTSCGPALQSMDVTISGIGSFSVTRNSTPYGYSTETYNFLATSASHTVTFAGTTTETCNLIIDNVQISLVSALPVTLVGFSAACNGDMTRLDWSTESESHNSYFTIDRSEDGKSWRSIAEVEGKGNSNETMRYFITDEAATGGVTYYRLSQTDADGTRREMKTVSASCAEENTVIAPNPVHGSFIITGAALPDAFYDPSGRVLHPELTFLPDTGVKVDLSSFATGTYFVRIGSEVFTIVKE
jgi:hypothetical protein